MGINFQHLKNLHKVTAGKCIFVSYSWQSNPAVEPEPFLPTRGHSVAASVHGPRSCQEQSLAQVRRHRRNTGIVKAYGL